MIVRVNGFVYESLPGRIVFGGGAQATIADEVAGLGAERVLLLSSPSATAPADALHAALGDVALRWTEVAEHVPVALAETVPFGAARTPFERLKEAVKSVPLLKRLAIERDYLVRMQKQAGQRIFAERHDRQTAWFGR